MKSTDFEKLGLNKNESLIFTALLQLGEATAGDLIKKTGFHRNIVYDNLEKLADKGLIIYITKDSVRYYSISSAEAILEFMKIEERKLKEKLIIAEKLTKDIKQAKGKKAKSTAHLFQGTLGIRDVMKDTLKENKDYIVYGAPGKSVELMGEHFWKNYNLKRKDKKIKVRMIFNQELKDFGKKLINKLTEIKYLPKQFDSSTETTIYNNKVAIMIWTEKPIVILIEDENLAKSYKTYFEILWRMAK